MVKEAIGVLFLTLFASALSGCVPLPILGSVFWTPIFLGGGQAEPKGPAFEAYMGSIKPLSAENGRIIFYSLTRTHPRGMGNAHGVTVVRLNDEYVGILGKLQAFHVDRPAGSYMATMIGTPDSGDYYTDSMSTNLLGRLSLDVNAGEEKYVRFEWDKPSKQLKTELVSQEIGGSEVRNTIYSYTETAVLVHKTDNCYVVATQSGYVIARGPISGIKGSRVIGSFTGVGSSTIIDSNVKYVGDKQFDSILATGLSNSRLHQQWTDKYYWCGSVLPPFSDENFPILQKANQ